MKELGKKKLLIIAGGIIGLVVLTIVILLIYNVIFGKVNYEDIENKVVEAAEKYYDDHKELLPKNENEQVSTTDSSLTKAGYLESMSELTKDMDGVNCAATVLVNYSKGEYRYTALLDCGENYKTVTLSSYITENEKTVKKGDGLYNLNGELVYRGEDPNNYVNFADKEWRIVKVTDNKVIMILNEKSISNIWDDRYNTERDGNDGINNYAVSRVKDSLEEMYNGETIFTTETKKLLVSHTLYIGNRGTTDKTNDGSLEKKSSLDNQYLGLLPLYDYINASTDRNCESASTNSCSNYNYLNQFAYNWWTLTADASNTYKVYKISNEGTISSIRTSSNGYIRPVIHLASDAVYASGDGTLENPYKIK